MGYITLNKVAIKDIACMWLSLTTAVIHRKARIQGGDFGFLWSGRKLRLLLEHAARLPV